MQITTEKKQGYLQKPQQFFEDLAAHLGTSPEKLTITGNNNRVLEGTVSKGERHELSGDPELFAQFLDTLAAPTDASGSRFVIAKTDESEVEKVYIRSPRGEVTDRIGFAFADAPAISTAESIESIAIDEPSQIAATPGDGPFAPVDDPLHGVSLAEVAEEITAAEGSFVDIRTDGSDLYEEIATDETIVFNDAPQQGSSAVGEIAVDSPSIDTPPSHEEKPVLTEPLAATPDRTPVAQEASQLDLSEISYRIEQVPDLNPQVRDWLQAPAETDRAVAERPQIENRLPLENPTVDPVAMQERVQTVAPLLDKVLAHYGESYEGRMFKARREGDALNLSDRQGNPLLAVRKQGEGFEAIGQPALTEAHTRFFVDSVAPVLDRKQSERLNRVLPTAGKLLRQHGKSIVTGENFRAVWSPEDRTLSIYERGGDNPIAVGKKLEGGRFENLGSRLTPDHEREFAAIGTKLQARQQAWVQEAGEITTKFLHKRGVTEATGTNFSAKFDPATGDLEVRERQSGKQIINARREPDGKFSDLGSKISIGHLQKMRGPQQQKQQDKQQNAPALVQ